MKRLLTLLGLLLVFGAPFQAALAADAPPVRPLEERVADIEAYMNNVARVANTNAATSIPGPGPGHNAWQMTSTALVLFMTLPGLALFYGGLVRRKNILSVMAQCLGIAGLVTILWWICGYSLSFAAGTPYLGGTRLHVLPGRQRRGGRAGQQLDLQ
jgi:Amt family ammonium transporter